MFDIVMPTFKREHTIHQTISSIQKQTFEDWNLIIVDNWGSDYVFDDERITYVVENKKHSAAYARNRGLQYCNSELICFFDDDDIMLSTYLEEVKRAFDKNSSATIAHVWIDSNHNNDRLLWATPCGILKRRYATPTWRDTSKLQDQKYFRNIIQRNRWSSKNIIYLDRILACVGQSNTGGLRDKQGRL